MILFTEKYNIVFLDIDGVLNNHKFLYQNSQLEPERRRNIDDDKVILLRDLITKTNAKVVLSSSWRVDFNELLMPLTETAWEIKSILEKHDVKIWDKTDTNLDKADSIVKWLGDNGDNIKAYVVIDDDATNLREEYLESFVKTSFYIGLTNNIVKQAVEILSEGKIKKTT